MPNACDSCIGPATDSDGDSVPDACDRCPGKDDRNDADGDGVPDDCDSCPAGNNRLDADGDGVPNECDVCPGGDDADDFDDDGTPDACDACNYGSLDNASADAPDPYPSALYEDTNCDGVDGRKDQSIFVNVIGSDVYGDGTLLKPFATVQKGIDVAAADLTRKHVLIAEGVYTERITLKKGVSLHGGYSGNFLQRGAMRITEIQSPTSPAIQATGDVGIVVVEGLAIDAPDAAPDKPKSSVGVGVLNVNAPQSLTLRGLKITAGRGANGSPGAAGAKGEDGHDSNTPDLSAEGLGCGSGEHNGGMGGGAGPSEGQAGSPGLPGKGPSGGSAGDGGSTECVSFRGGDGGRGGDGAAGTNAIAPSATQQQRGACTAEFDWAALAGNNSAAGSPGSGGGGAGGDGYADPYACSYAVENGGGGGGGGCGGGAGAGGAGGGGSIGILVINSDGVTLHNSEVRTGNAGSGGVGGNGGLPGAGGQGRHYSDNGPKGGTGGAGGAGGAGGGGGGGVSVAVMCSGSGIVCTQASAVAENNTLQFGSEGAGGAGGTSSTGAGPTGATGLAQATLAY